ncbi:MAG: 2,6-beta-D-fructofuranosidase, partial [Bacteroidales bacterium]
DYSEKYVGGVSKFLMELDPSYKTDKWNFWLSLRYYSKQYANKMNNVFFNGHWETFGGIEYKILDKVSLNMNVVNIFNDYGANGSIASADLITDPTLLNNYLISGKYIRPFTLEFSLKFEY